MSNRKIMEAHVIAYALNRREKWFVAPENWFWEIESRTIGRVWNKCVRIMKPAEGSRNRCFRLPGLTIVHGFTELRDYDGMRRHGDEIRRMFKYVGPENHDVVDFVDKCANSKSLVGVHVRRTDYREWRDGKYFYGNDVYERVVAEMQRLVGDAMFMVFTDETESLSPSLSALNGQPTTPERDQWLMSNCDYLIGPPSTFTTWASFMGKVPLLHLMDGEQKVRLSDFVMTW